MKTYKYGHCLKFSHFDDKIDINSAALTNNNLPVMIDGTIIDKKPTTRMSNTGLVKEVPEIR